MSIQSASSDVEVRFGFRFCQECSDRLHASTGLDQFARHSSVHAPDSTYGSPNSMDVDNNNPTTDIAAFSLLLPQDCDMGDDNWLGICTLCGGVTDQFGDQIILPDADILDIACEYDDFAEYDEELDVDSHVSHQTPAISYMTRCS